PGYRPGRVDRRRIDAGRQEDEREHPPPGLAAGAPALRIAGGPQPQRVAHVRPREAPSLPPDEDQGQCEDPDEPGVEADQERFGERFTAAEVVAQPGGDEPDESGHRAVAASHVARTWMRE